MAYVPTYLLWSLHPYRSPTHSLKTLQTLSNSMSNPNTTRWVDNHICKYCNGDFEWLITVKYKYALNIRHSHFLFVGEINNCNLL